jgi:hypothetical protein
MKKVFLISLTISIILLMTQCRKDCFKSNDCKLEGKAGPCDALISGYYYDEKEKKCVEFIWGGCGGVRPFATMEECEKNCHCK